MLGLRLLKGAALGRLEVLARRILDTFCTLRHTPDCSTSCAKSLCLGGEQQQGRLSIIDLNGRPIGLGHDRLPETCRRSAGELA